MSAKIASMQSGWLVARAWLNPLNEASIKYLGNKKLRVFCSIVDECASKQWLGILEREFGIKPERADGLKKAVENYIQVGILGGLFESESQFELSEDGSGRLQIRVPSCPIREELSRCSSRRVEGSADKFP